MNYKSIFKMEMFKFYKESPFFLSFLIVSAFNVICAILAVATKASIIGTQPGFLATIFYSVLPLSIIATFILLAIYPIQTFSIDYKNNVMATIIASGVDRVKLFLTKFVAIIINSILMTIISIFIPLLIIGISQITDGNIFEVISGIFSAMVESPNYVFYMIVSGLYTLAMLVFCAVKLKGSYIAILLYFLFAICVSIVNSMIMFSIGNFTESVGVGSIYQSILYIAYFILFMYLSIRTIKNQDL